MAKQKKYSYRGKGSTEGFYPSGFILVPEFKRWLAGILKEHKSQELSVTIRVKPPKKKKSYIVRFRNGKPYIPHKP